MVVFEEYLLPGGFETVLRGEALLGEVALEGVNGTREGGSDAPALEGWGLHYGVPGSFMGASLILVRG